MAQKQLLIFSWEYYGHHSAQGTALSKRPRQVAESFAANGWTVVVIHRDGTGECGDKPFVINHEASGVTRITVKMLRSYDDKGRNALVRRLSTLFYVARRGDRSYRWATDVIRNFNGFGISTKPDYIISFFTPRGPLYLGHYYAQKLGVPWIADIQDPLDTGIASSTLQLATKWMHNTLKTAKAIVHISPEWGSRDAAQVNLKVDVIRHAIPARVPASAADGNLLAGYEGYFNVFYGGSLSLVLQSLELLKKVMDKAATMGIKIKIHLAGNENARKNFIEGIGAEHINYIGWIDGELMNEYINQCDCTLLIPLSKQKVGIPSKFYDLCAYNTPIWVIGYDTGAFNSLFAEWKYPELKIADYDFQLAALLDAADGDFSKMFSLSNCKAPYLTAGNIYKQYIKLM